LWLPQPYVGGEALKHGLDTANNATADTLGVERPVQEGRRCSSAV
jgi:hypothetical protein